MRSAIDWLVIAGGTLGLLTFLWKLTDAFLSHVHIDLSCKIASHGADRRAIFSAKVDNQTAIFKRIYVAAVMVHPDSEDAQEGARHLVLEVSAPLRSRRHEDALLALSDRHITEAVYTPDRRRAWIPLPGFSSPGLVIGRETMTEAVTLRLSALDAGFYRATLSISVRYLFGMRRFRWTSLIFMNTETPEGFGEGSNE